MPKCIFPVLLCHPDHPPFPGPFVAPARIKDKGAGPGLEGAEGSAAVPDPVRLCHIPQSARVPPLQPKELWLQLR